MLKAELKSHGYTVLPVRQLSLGEGELVSEVRAQLTQCAVSVHLGDNSYGLVPDGPTQRSVVELQNQLAAERSRQAGLRRMIWIPEKTQGEHARQQEFIKALHLDAQMVRALQDGKVATLEYIYLSVPDSPDKELMISLEESNFIHAPGGPAEAGLASLFAALEAH
jgi:hypothetical protein